MHFCYQTLCMKFHFEKKSGQKAYISYMCVYDDYGRGYLISEMTDIERKSHIFIYFLFCLVFFFAIQITKTDVSVPFGTDTSSSRIQQQRQYESEINDDNNDDDDNNIPNKLN